METYPQTPIYLFFGNQTESMLAARDTIVNHLLPLEYRNENLTEYYPSGSTNTVSLVKLSDEIAGDMATISFISDANKVVVVTNPAELFERSHKPSKAKTRMFHWLEHELPQSGHTLILLAFEDESAQREVDQKSDLYALICKLGFVRGLSDPRAFFRIEDALVSRKVFDCIEAIRDLWKAGKGDMTVYNASVRCIRYLIQSNIARERKLQPSALALFFPGDAQRNLFKAHANVQRKYQTRPIYRTRDLLEAYQQLLEVYQALRPQPGVVYVPDAQGLLVQILTQLMLSAPPVY